MRSHTLLVLAALALLSLVPAPASAAVTVEKASIPIEGGYLDATISRPGPGTHPAVVVAAGLGGLYSGNPAKCAERFVEAGMTVVGFDYRHFGASTGTPRRVIDLRKQRRDWRAAIAFAKRLAGVDSSRIALWGTSMSGGHVLFLGTEYPELKAVVSQVPHMDGRGAAARQDPRTFAGIASLTALDLASAAVGGSPVQVPLIGRPGTAALMTAPGAWEYAQQAYVGTGWINAVPARASLSVLGYSPVLQARASKVPTQIMVATGDKVAPPEPARRLARTLGADVLEVDTDHFGVYSGPIFETMVARQTAFLRARLGLDAAG